MTTTVASPILDFYIECPATPASRHRCTMLNLKYPSNQGIAYQQLKQRVRQELGLTTEVDFDLDYEYCNQGSPTRFSSLANSEPYIRLRVGLPARFLYNHNLGIINTKWRSLAPDSEYDNLQLINPLPQIGSTQQQATDAASEPGPSTIPATEPQDQSLTPEEAAAEVYQRTHIRNTIGYSSIFFMFLLYLIWLRAVYVGNVSVFLPVEQSLYISGLFLGGYIAAVYHWIKL